MNSVAAAFAELGRLLSLNGRRLQKTYEQSRYRLVHIEHGSPMLYVPMASRKHRRRAQGRDFRPVPGRHTPPQNISHAETIAMMRNMWKEDR